MKKLLYILGGLVVLLIVGVVVVVMSINSIAKTGIEKGGTYALGVKTTVSSVSVGILSGKFGMSGLKVANPDGFKSDKFMSLGDGGVQVSLGTLRKDTVDLPSLGLDTLEVNLEKTGGKANYNVILDNLKKVTGSGGESKPAPQPAGKEKKFIINDLSIKKVTVHADLIGGPGDLTKVTVPIDEVHLKDVGKDKGGVTMGELSGIIVQAILTAAIEKGGGLIPADMLGDLKNGLAGLGDLSKLGLNVVGDAKGTLEKVGGEAGKAVEEGSKKVEEIGKGLGGLIPGGKKDEKKDKKP